MRHIATLLILALLAAGTPLSAEVIEDIVAFVNGDVITMSDLEQDDQTLMAGLYRNYTGDELDRQAKKMRAALLLNMIDNKILLHQAQRIADLDRMAETYYEMFKRQQGLSDEDVKQQILDRENMSMEELQELLIAMFAPEDVIRAEVGGRVAVGDPEVEAYYQGHLGEFTSATEVTLREIVLLVKTSALKDEVRREAERVRQLSIDGDFAEVARQYSEAGTKDEGGMLGKIKEGDLSAELEAAAFDLPLDEVSEVIETTYGFHFLKVVERADPEVTPLDEVREPLRQMLETQHFNDQLSTYKEKARAEAEWCVKAKYGDRLAEDHQPAHICQSL